MKSTLQSSFPGNYHVIKLPMHILLKKSIKFIDVLHYLLCPYNKLHMVWLTNTHYCPLHLRSVSLARLAAIQFCKYIV